MLIGKVSHVYHVMCPIMSDACGKLIIQHHVFAARMSITRQNTFVAHIIASSALKGTRGTQEFLASNAVSIISKRAQHRIPLMVLVFMRGSVCVMSVTVQHWMA